ncbi:TonB-dependent receptor [Catenovulum sp. SX2]|uniref:TonB-dependent receptor n=1 Tax=Catenovulum sp. SX2 TaxID=3398614 RepID=UPI003F857C03
MKFNKSILSTAIALAILPNMAFSAEANPEESTEVIQVKGVRGSLAKALDIKREETAIVDAIVAEDIGKFPDNNVVEALQHVTGVQVGPRTTGEASEIVIRGFSQVGTTMNGRNIFTGVNRNFALQDIPATLVKSAKVYKTTTADMVEGGMAGMIDVETWRPFDFDGFKFSVNAKATYSDQSDKFDPNITALLSNTWQTDIGKVGALVNVSYQRLNFRDNVIWTGGNFPYNRETGAMIPYVAGTGIEGGIQLDTTPGSTLTHPTSGEIEEYVIMRDAMGAIDYWGERERPAVSASLQWQPSDASEYYLDIFYNKFDETRNNSFLFTRVDGDNASTEDEDWLFFEGTNVVKSHRADNPFVLLSSQARMGETTGIQGALGGKWSLSDQLTASAELSVLRNETKNLWQIFDIYQDYPGYLVTDFNNNGSGTASLQYFNADGSEGSLVQEDSKFVSGTYFDGNDIGTGHSTSFRADISYLTEGFITEVEAGIRLDTRGAEQDKADSVYGGTLTPLNETEVLMGTTPGDFFQGEQTYPIQWSTPDADWLLANQGYMRENFGNGDPAKPAVLPTEHFDITEDSIAVYAQAGFAADIGDMYLSGKAGVRYVKTDSELNAFEIDDEGAKPRMIDSSDSEILPSLTATLEVSDDFWIRASASKTLTRPNFTDLNPSMTLRAPIDGQIQQGTGAGGNPDLKPILSTNLDVSFEYYFAEDSNVYFAVFQRDIEGLIISRTENVNLTNDLFTGVYQLTRPVNGEDGKSTGLEAGITYFPDFGDSFLNGFGFQANYTYVDADRNGLPITNVSKRAYTGALIYETGPVSARFSYVYRDAYKSGENTCCSMPIDIMVDELDIADVSVSYDLTDNLTVTLDGTNLFGGEYKDYFGNAAIFNRDTRRYSKTYSLSVRYDY